MHKSGMHIYNISIQDEDSREKRLLPWYAGVIQLLFWIGHLHLIGTWLGEDQKTCIIIIKRDWNTSSNFINYSTL